MDSVEEKKGKNNEDKPKFVARTPTDIQRIKLEKLMKNPQKEVNIPQLNSKKNGGDGIGETPSFVRNVMGSSAGAGSGEFHVYRHLRRKEYARQKQIQQQGVKEQMEDDFRRKIEQNRLLAEQKTAKKRAKRLKKKQRAKHRKPNENAMANESQNSESSDSDSNDDVDNKKSASGDVEPSEKDSKPENTDETEHNPNKKDEKDDSD
ncbi:PRKR-interacting protein 1 homolog [Sitodiplosis mosellana]|uniref:PRKR-interacting protein 1 homolog n=1 Tax=Sitodiplosis mosellana TaxID=263140 RepID=UPI002444E46C|nr:PRKR-interacting protein 1 homolog [Sitodiplosis mosellana]